MDGILVLNKPKGMTSGDCVYQLRKILKEKKIGHTGTLDKEVDGVLVLCIGQATKLVELLMEHEKEYVGTCLLGLSSKTEDIFGEIIEKRETIVHEEKEIKEALNSFLGAYMQKPPMYSSLKVDGKKLYQYALKDIEIERKEREITIHEITFIDYQNNEIKFKVKSSKGLYFRTLCVDLAKRLQEIGCMKELTRTKLGNYSINEAVNLEDVSEEKIISLDEIIKDFPTLEVKEYLVKLIKNGITLDERQTNIQEPFVCTYKGISLALYKPIDGVYKPVLIL